MSISTITINTVEYTAYASLAEANAYLAVDATRSAAWAALTDDQKGANLVAATRRLDAFSWEGTKTGAEGTQVNAWPRTNVTYDDGTAVSTSDVPIEIENATILIAGSIALDSSVGNVGTSAGNIRRVKAGSAEVENFRPTAGLPLQDETAYFLIKQFLASGSISAGSLPIANGGDAADAVFADDQLGFTLDNDGYP